MEDLKAFQKRLELLMEASQCESFQTKRDKGLDFFLSAWGLWSAAGDLGLVWFRSYSGCRFMRSIQQR